VPDRLKILQGLSTYALTGRIGRDQVREGLFQVEKFMVKPVVFAIRDNRLSLDVIPVIVLADLFDEGDVAGFGFGMSH
jgi:hypothetical protein